MTDEEKDKTEKKYKEWLINDHKLLDNPTYCDIEQKCFRAFFAGTRYGLTEDRKEKWHDLRKDPNDLPKECQNVLCLCNDIGYKYYCTGHFIYKTWFSNIVSKKLRVIAWCELPEFKE